jgi:hypothetical protein
MGMAAIASAFLEADPSVDWDDERLATVRQALSTLAVPNG